MFNNINYIWRVFATGLCFVIFGLGGLLLSFIVFPIQKLFTIDEVKRKHRARKTVHFSFKFFIGLLTKLGVYRFTIKGAEQLNDLNGHLIVANHPTLIDVVILISLIPNADCIVKSHLFTNVFLKGVFNSTGYISNNDPEGLLQDCDKSLSAGNNLVIFPQGTRTKSEDELNFQRGAANISVRCQAKVKTVLINVSPSTLTKSVAWYDIPKIKAHFCVDVIANDLKIPENKPELMSKNARSFNRALEFFFIKELKKYE